MSQTTPSPTAKRAVLALALLLAINLFNYIDRYVLAAVEPLISKELLPGDPDATAKTGSLATAFLFSYMLLAPVFGWIADRYSRWVLIGCSVALWTLASGWSGMAASFSILLITRIFVGVGEAGYGPSAPTIIADLYPVERRGQMLSLFYMAIPVGSALGYMLGGIAGAHLHWRWAFYLVVPPGLLLAFFCFLMKDTRVHASTKPQRPDDQKRGDTGSSAHASAEPEAPKGFRGYLALFRIPSYALNTAAMTAMTFAIGGMAFWMPRYVFEYRKADFGGVPSLDHINFVFGAISAVGGLLATMFGGWLGDRLRRKYESAYFWVSGVGILLAFPPTVAMLFVPFPYAWIFVFLAIFFLFFNTGPSNTVLANVTKPTVRASAFALNIFVIHVLGDAISPPLMGWLAPRTSWNVAFLVVAAMMVVAGICWLIGTRYLAHDTAVVTEYEESLKRVADRLPT